jgi:hypothetical protein
MSEQNLTFPTNPFPSTKKNIALGATFPSSTPGAVLDIKKGRAYIALNMDELEFLAGLYSLLTFSGVTNSSAGTGPLVDTPVTVPDSQ